MPTYVFRFVEGYILALNATKAAIHAGCRSKATYRTGVGLIKRPQILKIIDQSR
ncbi:MAG: terminase small subunit [Pseudomonadota bacterium]